MKKLFGIILSLTFICSSMTVFAYEIPKSFWPIDNKYRAALNSSDSYAIIELAKQAIAIMKNEPKNEQVLQILGSRTEMIAKSYEALGDYPSAADYFENYADYAAQLNWDDAVKIAKSKAQHYRLRLELYEQVSEPQIYYNAKNEPQKGVMYGVTSDSTTRHQLPNESIILLYHEFGDRNYDWLHYIFREAQNKNIRILFALNVPREGSDILEVPYSGEYFDSLLNEIAQYPDVPVYFRFAAEMNIWENRSQPEDFVKAFRFVADKVHSRLANTAMVWSVNQTSSWDLDMHDFYPGDEYVDWIGVASYLSRYFLGRDDWSQEEKFNENVFYAGDSADPILALEEVVSAYGNRKPIMLTESGASHYMNSLGRDETEWAIKRLQQQYNFVPRVYPQVKAICYFDKVIPHENNNYALTANSALASEYFHAIQSPMFVQGTNFENTVTYQWKSSEINIKNPQFLFGVYPHVYGNITPNVSVYFDDAWLMNLSAPNYSGILDFSGENEGNHTLKLVIDGVIEKEYTISYNKPIQLYLNKKQLQTDVAPVISDGRTLVPVRIISENLNVQVSWNPETREVKVQKDGIEIILGIDYSKALVNGISEDLDVPPQIIDGRTFVPIRFLSEKFNLEVDWQADTRSVYLCEKNNF